jgi:hypothetical protein
MKESEMDDQWQTHGTRDDWNYLKPTERRVDVVAAVRLNATGETRVVPFDLPFDDADPSADPEAFFWSDGNYRCDCNRHLEFMRAGSEYTEADEESDAMEHECGDTAYSVELRHPVTGRAFYSEIDATQA